MSRHRRRRVVTTSPKAPLQSPVRDPSHRIARLMRVALARASTTASLSTSGRRSRVHRPRASPRRRARERDEDADRFFKTVEFDGLDPERKAASALTNLLTMAAVRVVLDQMWGTRHRSPMAPKLIDYLQTHPLRDGRAWLAELMSHDELDYRLVAVRVIETRKVLAETPEGFDYDWMREESLEGIAKDNLDLSRALLACSLASGDCEPDFTREA